MALSKLGDDGEVVRGGNELNKVLSKKDAENLLKLVLNILVKDFNITQKDVLCIFEEIYEKNIPISIFGTRLNPSEALVKFLKEEKGMNYHEIAMAINRDERGIWGSYHRAVESFHDRLPLESKYHIPLEIFRDRKFSILENVIMFLRDVLRLKNPDIAKLLNKTPSTVATVYNRAKKKQKVGK
ncbi:hypothetical protein DRJ17_01990 [Candidatus Woesearchaeota archaeon]|nr:MAG: hypothetical protein DRJ17_01990 [Candidatus Woesearchaeota archaeon]